MYFIIIRLPHDHHFLYDRKAKTLLPLRLLDSLFTTNNYLLCVYQVIYQYHY